MEDKKKIYLFKSGIFYIALSKDAEFLSKKYSLNLTRFNDEVKKCGFPIKSLSKYLKIFDNDNVKYEIVKEPSKDEIIKVLEKVNIDDISPLESLNILNKLKELL